MECRNCAKNLEGSQRIYCSNRCQVDHIYAVYVEKWLRGEVTGRRGEFSMSGHVRRWLFEQHGGKCQKCAWAEVNPTTGKVPLEIHHVDGSYENCRPENLNLLCPNCHALTPNAGILNAGKGRRYKRISMPRLHNVSA